MSIFLLLPHPIYNCPMCDEAMSEVPEGKLLNWERRKHIFIRERFQVLPSLLSPSASLPFFPSRTEHAASRFVCDFSFFPRCPRALCGTEECQEVMRIRKGLGTGQCGTAEEENRPSKLFFSAAFASSNFPSSSRLFKNVCEIILDFTENLQEQRVATSPPRSFAQCGHRT